MSCFLCKPVVNKKKNFKCPVCTPNSKEVSVNDEQCNSDLSPQAEKTERKSTSRPKKQTNG